MAKSTVNVDSYADLGRYYLPDRQKIDVQVRKKIDDQDTSSENEQVNAYNNDKDVIEPKKKLINIPFMSSNEPYLDSVNENKAGIVTAKPSTVAEGRDLIARIVKQINYSRSASSIPSLWIGKNKLAKAIKFNPNYLSLHQTQNQL